jgi:hypothetical protein
MPPEDINKLLSRLITQQSIIPDFLNQETRLKVLRKISKEYKLKFTREERKRLLVIEADSLSEYAERYLKSEQQLINQEREGLS